MKLDRYLNVLFIEGFILGLTNVRAEFYSVDPSEAYTWNKAFPQSCACAENGKSASDCELFKCKCVCDVRAGFCDYGCCCDPDCSSDQISRFKTLDYCQFEGFESDSIEYCYSSAELYGVNPKAPMGGQPSANEGVSRALCVEKKNYAFKDEFYTNSELQDSQVFNQDAGQKPYSYLTDSLTEASAESIDNYYDQNDSIPAFTLLTSGDFVSNGPGYLQLPQGDQTGQCNDNVFALFEQNIPPKSCNRELSATEDVFSVQCSGLSVDHYVTSLFLSKQPNNLASYAAASASNTIPVSLDSIIYEDFYTKERNSVTLSIWESASCETSVVHSSAVNLTSLCLHASDTALLSLLNSSSFCNNMVKEVTYSIRHDADASASLSSALAEVVITDVPYSAAGWEIEQKYGIGFYSNSSASASSANGNLVPRQRSGNPGYLLGAPVLYGYEGDSVVNELVEGFTLPSVSSFTTTCPTSLTVLSSVPSAFGYDTITGCTLELSRDELKDFCCSGAPGSCLDNSFSSTVQSSPYSSSSGLPYFLNLTDGYVGMYGDADPLDLSQWFSLSLSLPSDQRAWNDKTSTCSSMYAALQIQFLVSYSGERLNPQNKITSAAAQVVTADWVFTLPAKDNSTRQSFQLNAVVSYVFQDENDLKGYEPPPPPVLFKMPYDVFYPFVVNAASPARSVALPWVGLTVFITSLVMSMR